MKPGIHIINNDDYHGGPGISKSGLDKINKCPAWFKYCLDNPTEQTPAMRLGAATHALVLEPETFEKDYAVAPEINRRTKAGKLDWEEFCLASSGKDVLSMQEAETARAISEAVYGNAAARRVLSADSRVEHGVYWNDPITGTLCKCKPDMWRNDNILVDLKTTKCASPAEFAKSAYNFRYHVQAAYYMDGVEQVTGERPKGFVFVAVETSAPYLVSVFAADDQMILLGQDAYRQDLDLYAECMESGIWPGYPEEVVSLQLPPWAKKDLVANF